MADVLHWSAGQGWDEGFVWGPFMAGGSGTIQVVATSAIRNVELSPLIITTPTVRGGESTQFTILPTEVKRI